MASPQLEDGFTRFANEIVEAMARLVLNSKESRCLWAIWRRTYGFQRKTDRISLSQISEATGLTRGHACNALASLARRKIIDIGIDGQYRTYAFQKDHSQWDMDGPQGRKGRATGKGDESTVTDMGNTRTVTHIGNELLPISVTNCYPNGELQKKERKGTKENNQGERLRKAHPPKEAKNKKEKAPPDPRTNRVMERIQTIYGKPIINWATHAATVKKMLAAGYSEDQIVMCWEVMFKEKGKLFPMSWLAEDIGDRIHNGGKLPGRSTNGHDKKYPGPDRDADPNEYYRTAREWERRSEERAKRVLPTT